MPRVLLTGMSGVGKSAVAIALADRGVVAIDTDHEASRVAADGEWLWDEPAIERALERDDHLVVIVGSAANQVAFYPRFDRIVLLSAPVEVMVERIASRTTNPFGKEEAELAKILADTAAVEPMLRRRADCEIRTDRPLDEVVDEVMRVVGDTG